MCIGIFLTLLIGGILSSSVTGSITEKTDESKTEYNEFEDIKLECELNPKELNLTKRIKDGLDIEFENSISNENNSFKLKNNFGNIKITLQPPWNSDWVKHKNKWGISDCWQENTEIDGESGKTTLHSWAGPGAGLATIDVNLRHYKNFRPPKESDYSFTYKFHQEGEIKIESMELILGASAARGTVTFYYYLWDGTTISFEKSIVVEEHISIGGINNGEWSYSKTKSYCNSAHLEKDVLYTFGVNGIPYVASDGIATCAGSADHWVTKSSLQKVEIEWPNSPPNTPENVGPDNGETDVSTSTNLRWSCDDPDGYYDSLMYDVYFGTSSNPPRVSSGETSTIYAPGSLKKGETYYWKIKAIDRKGAEKTSPIWKFTTKENGCCFPAGTKITLADGTYKNIENIKIGDKVLSYDTEKNRFDSWRVKLPGGPIHPVITINKGLIKATVDHPFYIKKPNGKTCWGAYNVERAKKFTTKNKDILKMEIGDKIFTSDRDWIEITDIKYNPEPVQTYNILSFSGTKTYFANDLLVYEEHPPHIITDWVIKIIGKKLPRLEKMLDSSIFFNKLLENLP